MSQCDRKECLTPDIPPASRLDAGLRRRYPAAVNVLVFRTNIRTFHSWRDSTAEYVKAWFGTSRVQVETNYSPIEKLKTSSPIETGTEKATLLSQRGLYLCRQRPTLPHTFACSTIGPAGLNFRVRYGNGWIPRGKITDNWIARGARESC